jgi:hypothetical protein
MMMDELFSDVESEEEPEFKYDLDRKETKFKSFLDGDGGKRTDKGDSQTTIINRTWKSTHAITENTPESKKFFKLYDNLGDNHKIIIYEKQSDNSGLMIDLDMYFKKPTVVILPKHRKEFCMMVAKIMFECFDIQYIHQAVIIKPLPHTDGKKMLLDDPEKKCFKDGFHVLVPDVLMTKNMRKFILNVIQIRLKTLPSFAKIKFAHAEIVDLNSAHVGVHFVNSPSKVGKDAYTLENVWACNSAGDIKDIKSRALKKYNIPLEFSLNKWGGEELIKKVSRVFNSSNIPKFNDFLAAQVAKNTKKLEDDNKYKPTAKQMAEVSDDELGFIGHISEMISSLPDAIAEQGKNDGGGWHRLISCIASIADVYKLTEYRSDFIEMLDEFSQRGGDSYKNTRDVESVYDNINKFGYVGFLLYLIRENSSDSAELIEAFGKDFPTHVKAVIAETVGLSPVERSIYDLYYAKANAGELNDVTSANALVLQFAGDVVVSNDDGDGYKFCDKDVLWKPCKRQILLGIFPMFSAVFCV